MSAQSVCDYVNGGSKPLPEWMQESARRTAEAIERQLEHKRQYDAKQWAFIEAHCIMLGHDCFLDSSEADDRYQETFGLVYAERREGRDIS
jgi:hypothetical protein